MAKGASGAHGKEPPRGAPGPGAVKGLAVASLVGIGLLVALSAYGLVETRRIRKGFEERLGQLDGRIADLGTKVNQALARTAAPPRSGPDPARVYTIRTEGAPAEGAPGAPVTIAEFSDFQ